MKKRPISFISELASRRGQVFLRYELRYNKNWKVVANI